MTELDATPSASSVLVGAALDDVRLTGRRIEATCWYVAQFVAEHPEYADLLPTA